MSKPALDSRRWRLAAVSLLITAALGATAVAMPSATAPPPAPRPTEPPRHEVVQAGFGSRTVILGPKASKKILAGAGVGTSSAAALICQAVVPMDIKQYCGPLMTLAFTLVTVGDRGDKCLAITTGIALPPLRVNLVPCPVDNSELVA